jgi:hypothetical protein
LGGLWPGVSINANELRERLLKGGLWWPWVCVPHVCECSYVQDVACALCGMCCLIDRYTMVRRAEIAGLKSTGAKH